MNLYLYAIGLFITIAIVAAAWAFIRYMEARVRMKELEVQGMLPAGVNLSGKPKEVSGFWRSVNNLFTQAVPVEKEGDIILKHGFDGIHELDNRLPPWWLWLFYITIIWAGGYYAYYHLMGGPSSYDEYNKDVKMAAVSAKSKLASGGAAITEDNVTLLTDKADLEMGKTQFNSLCVACHLADGGGSVGPNLTDEYWIHGGGIHNVFKTIKYGVPEKGMISWKDQLNPVLMQKVASYVLSLQGTKPATPKAPQGDKWVEGATPPPAAGKDTTTVKPATPPAK